MLKILYVSHESESVLGSSKSLYNMIHSLKNEVIPIVLVPKKGPAYEFFLSKGIKCMVVPYPLDITDKHGIKYYVSFLPRLLRDWIINMKTLSYAKKLFLKDQICLIHSNSSTVDWGFKLSRKLNLPHVWHLREFQDLDFNFRPFRGWKYLLREVHSSESTVSITNAIRDHFKLSGKDKALQLFNAVRRKDEISYSAEKNAYFLLCGMLSKAKGLELAIESFALFSKKVKGYKLLFVGIIDPTYRKCLEDLALSLGLENSIEFHAYTNNIDDYFRMATAFLMCSKNEAMGRVTVEAMFNGCPIIGYDGGGTKEIIKDGYNGLRFKTAEECAAAMYSIISGDKKNDLIKRGHEIAEKYFSEESYRGQMMDIYSSILRK